MNCNECFRTFGSISTPWAGSYEFAHVFYFGVEANLSYCRKVVKMRCCKPSLVVPSAIFSGSYL